jgi:L-seryl-tRNA(Ser) seleniumtransferase
MKMFGISTLGMTTRGMGYIRDDAYHLDLRCLETKDEAHFVAQLHQLKF